MARRLVFAGAVLLAAPSSVHGWDIELHDMRTTPEVLREGESFDVLLDLAYNGCQPTIESVDVLGSLVSIEGSAGPPSDGGCGGVIVDDFLLSVPVPGLGAGDYRVDATFFRKRDGAIADALQGFVRVRGAAEIPAVSRVGTVLFLLAMAGVGVRLLAS